MARRLDELLQREPAGPARDTLLRLATAGREGAAAPTAPTAPAQAQRAPITRTELPDLGAPTENPREAVQRAVDKGIPREVAGQAATQALEAPDEGPGFWTHFLTALPMLLAGPGAFAATLASQSVNQRLQGQRQSARERAAQATGQVTRAILEEYDRAAGDPVSQQNLIVRGLREIEGNPNLVADEPDLLPTMVELAKGMGTAPAELSTHEEKLAAAGLQPGTREAKEFLLGRPPVPSAVFHQPADEKRASIMAAERAAPGGLIDVELKTLDAQITNTTALLGLLESGVEPGKWTDAVKAAVKERFGVDVGLDPRLEAFNSIAASETLTALGAIKGNPTEGERAFVQQLTAQTGRGPEANKAVLRVRKSVQDRQRAELREEKAYYARNGTLAGFDTYIQDWGAKQGPVIPDDVIRSVTGDLAKNQAAQAQTFTGLAGALQAGDAAAVAGFVGELTREQLAGLPTATLEAIDRLLGQ